ncbi:hypothetical protein EV191_1011009 [Tamaricihabitans halophyticus]|uniref:Lysylphosphatidylglycerol synthase-like protein n=1 Tax=Tamaricihabitans halophyticus TaxID=1262583 RepID=A0A4R2R4W3_9PSEU|nr:lysylphosphatidylglycerol synthase transmembrane domain-containing protein [Tamaricihabitans halophyticus]TCP57057.1 hypothetical protein EV191_1011009 [Tamaricihabitans halophyticus]
MSAETAASTTSRNWRSLAVTWARRILLAAVLVGAGYYLVTRWDEVWDTLARVPWPAAVLSQLVLILGIASSTLGWQVIVDDLGTKLGPIRGPQIYLVGQLGKYLPGAVWAYVLQMELGKQAGLPRARSFVSSLIQVGVSTVASLLLGVLALPVLLDESPGAIWLYAVLPVGLAALHPRLLTWAVNLVLRILRKAPLAHRLRWATVGKALGYSLFTFTCFGTHLWLLANSLGTPGWGGLLLCTGAVAIGLTAGLFFFILPSGAGVREVVVTAALATSIGPVAAGAYAIASRAMFTAADVVTAGAAALLARGYRGPAKGIPSVRTSE